MVSPREIGMEDEGGSDDEDGRRANNFSGMVHRCVYSVRWIALGLFAFPTRGMGGNTAL